MLSKTETALLILAVSFTAALTGPETQFELGFENVTLMEGTREEVYCSARGERPMTYKWYNQSDDPVPEISTLPVYVSNYENGSWLIFEEVSSRHNGLYTCTAENSHGLSSKEYLINVSPAKSNNTNDGNSTSLDVKEANISASDVQFRIAVTGSVRYIEVKYSESRDTTEYQTRFAPASGDIYGISNLVPSGLYRFWFRVMPSENETWSNMYNVTLLPDVPEIILQKVDASRVKLQFYRMVDDIMRNTTDKHEIKYNMITMQSGGNAWVSYSCPITIQIPTCSGSSYTIAGLQQRVFYQIEVRAHTAAGYGEPAIRKIYLG